MDICDRVTSKYAAFCDGDDFWTNENKLQKQYDFMESNNDVNICAHKTKIQADKEWSLYDYYAKQDFIQPNEDNIPSKNRLILSDIVYEWPHTSSLFIRWNNIEIPANLRDKKQSCLSGFGIYIILAMVSIAGIKHNK